jgi:hypothetical protein
MRKTYWKSYELKRFGMHPKSVRAFMRIQRNQMYRDKKYAELKRKILCALRGLQNPWY